MRIHSVVEYRDDPRCARHLNGLSGACAQLGCDVIRWTRRESIPTADVAIVWNGDPHWYGTAVDDFRARGGRVLFAELGWLPQDDWFQLDPAGVNVDASWVSEPLGKCDGQAVSVPDGPLLVCLQNDGDTAIMRHSPWFRNSIAWLRHLEDHAAIPMRVRPHPLAATQSAVEAIVNSSTKMEWDESPTFGEAMEGVAGVACINSTCGVEAIGAGLPVMCYGNAIYRHAGAVWCMTSSAELTRERTTQLASGNCDLLADAQREMIERIRAHQWNRNQLAERLGAMFSRIGVPTF